MTDDITDSRLCALLRRKAERLGEERKAEGFTRGALADAALIEAMSMAGGTSKQVRAWLLALSDEALCGPAHANLPELPPDASPDAALARAEALRAQAAVLKAEADAAERWLAEAKRRGAGPGTPLSSVFTEAELAEMVPGKWLTRPRKRAPRPPKPRLPVS
jgi:hypothetical protein